MSGEIIQDKGTGSDKFGGHQLLKINGEAGFDQSFLDPALSVAWDTQVTIAVCWWQRLSPSSLGLFGHVTLEMALSWCGVVFWHKKEQAFW